MGGHDMSILNITNYSKSGIDKIKSVSILENKDLSNITNLSQELQRVFEVHQVFRTETEMRYSVLDDVRFPTCASKYWQSIREQNVFFTNLIYLSCEYEKTQGQLELLDLDLQEIDKTTPRGKAQEKIKKADIKQAQFSLMEMRLTAKDRVREIMIWEQIKNELKLKDNFNINDANADQFNSLQERWKRELDLSQIAGNDDLLKNSMTGLRTMCKGKDFNV